MSKEFKEVCTIPTDHICIHAFEYRELVTTITKRSIYLNEAKAKLEEALAKIDELQIEIDKLEQDLADSKSLQDYWYKKYREKSDASPENS